jgi:hypothetical protein
VNAVCDHCHTLKPRCVRVLVSSPLAPEPRKPGIERGRFFPAVWCADCRRANRGKFRLDKTAKV